MMMLTPTTPTVQNYVVVNLLLVIFCPIPPTFYVLLFLITKELSLVVDWLLEMINVAAPSKSTHPPPPHKCHELEQLVCDEVKHYVILNRRRCLLMTSTFLKTCLLKKPL